MDNLLKRLDYINAVFNGERKDCRNEIRLKTLRKCRVVFGEQLEGMNCFLMDISKSGARLRPADATKLPDRFDLEIEQDVRISCEVAHRTHNELGVAFRFDK
jgi:hypothetical protein